MIQIERKDIYAALIVFLLALGMGYFPQKTTLADFSSAMQIRAALLGQDAPLHAQVAARLEALYASVIGTAPNTPSTIVSFLIAFPSLLLAIVGVLAYFTLRALDFSKSFSAFAAIVFTLAALSISFMPSVYGSAQLSCAFFFAFLFLFAMHVREKSKDWLIAAAFFALISGYLSLIFALAGIIVVVAFGISSWMKNRSKEEFACFAALVALFAVAGALSPENAASFGIATMASALYGMPFLVAAAFCAAVLFFFKHARPEYLVLILGAIALAGISPLAAASLLVLPAAEGMSRASGDMPKSAKLACAYFVVFFAVFGMAIPLAGAWQAFIAGALIAVLAPLLVYFYGYNNKAFFVAFAAVLVAASVITVMMYQQGLPRQGYPTYADSDLSNALSFFSSQGLGR